MNDDPVADQSIGDHGAGADRAIAADPHLGTDHGVRADHGAAADLGARPDRRAGFDGDAVFQPRGGMHMGGRRIVRPHRARMAAAHAETTPARPQRKRETVPARPARRRGPASHAPAPRWSGRRRHGSGRPRRQSGHCRESSDRDGAARSSERNIDDAARGSGVGSSAPVKAAISASVRPRVCRWNTGSLMPPVPCRQPRSRSELRAAAEPEELRTVVARLGQGIGKIEAQRPERGIPDETHTDRRAHRRRRRPASVSPVTAQEVSDL